jgi:hypothetical protein
MKHAQGDFSQERIDYFAKLVAESDCWITPTLITSRSIIAIFDDVDELIARPEASYVHPMGKGIWSFVLTNLYQPIPPDHRIGIRNGFEFFQLPLTKALHDAGAKLMTGTDSFLPGIVQGFSVHHELEELVGVGLSPFEALLTSTTRPIEFLGELDKAGTIETGKRADLVLLEENPLEDITSSRKIAGVMISGRWLSKTEIQEGLAKLADSYSDFSFE